MLAYLLRDEQSDAQTHQLKPSSHKSMVVLTSMQQKKQIPAFSGTREKLYVRNSLLL